jgi:hypothetical protein
VLPLRPVLPNRVFSGVALGLLAAGCVRTLSLSVDVQVCGALCDDAGRDPHDFSGMDCASQVRFRAYAAGQQDQPPLAESCVTLGNGTQLSDLFDTGSGGAGAAPQVLQGITGSQPVQIEVALYAPGGAQACPADAPFVGLGLSEPADVRGGTNAILIPLGCHTLCGPQASTTLTLDLEAIEPGSDAGPPSASPSGIGDIYAYDRLEATGGACTPPVVFHPQGDFRLYGGSAQGNVWSGQFSSDPSTAAGCLAARVPFSSATTYACLGVDGGVERGWLLSSDHLLALLALDQQLPTASNGMLVVGATDSLGAAAVGATLQFGPTGDQAQYVSADFSSIAPVGGMTSAGLALFHDAPTGPFLVTFSNGQQVWLNAGGAEPGSVTTWSVAQ